MAKRERTTDLVKRAKRAGWGKWIKTEADERAVKNGCTFDVTAAERVRSFFRELLVHSKGNKFAGKPFELLDWQWEEIIGPLFGWKRADGSRRFRRGYVEIPKKNGKSTLASGISIYMLLCDDAGAEVYSCAVDKDQAAIVYDEAANMVEASADLRAALKVTRSQRTISYLPTRSKYEALASDADSSEGKNASCIIADELHAWRDSAFFDSVLYSGRAREQPLFLMVTTAGDDLQSVGGQEHAVAADVLAGTVQMEHYFSYIRSAQEKIAGDWKEPKKWYEANPCLGITIPEETLATDCKEAQESPRKEIAFRRYTLNQWVGSSEAWLSSDLWETCGQPFDEAELLGLDCWGGLDLSRTRDLSALVWVFSIGDPPIFYFLPRLYMPEDRIAEREKTDKFDYRRHVQAGRITATPGDVVDYAYIRADVLRDAEKFNVVELGYDPANAEHLANQELRLQDGIETISVAQTMVQMGPPTSELERLLKEGRVRHGGHPVLAWMAGNVAVYEDTNGSIRPIKRKSRGRIDGMVASIIGLGRCLAGGRPGSFYDHNTTEMG